MKLQLLSIFAALLVLASCSKESPLDQDLSGKDRMNQLVVSDPLVWNSLVKQFIEVDTTNGALKSGNGVNEMAEYPGSGKYYYAVFEDLYPSQGDYDFNDVILQTRLLLESRKGEFWGTINTTLLNRGGSLKTRLGLMFYSFDGKKGYTRISNDQITINGENLKGDEPFTMDMPSAGTDFKVDYNVRQGEVAVKYIWITWFILVDSSKETREIHSSGFPVSKMVKFEIPQRDFLTANNLPWGLEIESEKFFVPMEKAFFIDAFPEFQAWAESNGQKNTSWFRNPNFKFIQ
jgi:hypothetical protein